MDFSSAFWSSFSKELHNKKYATLLMILSDISHRIMGFVPHRLDLHSVIRENIDVMHLQQMLEHDAVDTTYIYTIIQYIISELKTYDCAQDEPYYEIWRCHVNKMLEDPDSDLEMHQKLILFFREAYRRIEKIEYSIADFKASSTYQAIKDMVLQKVREREP